MPMYSEHEKVRNLLRAAHGNIKEDIKVPELVDRLLANDFWAIYRDKPLMNYCANHTFQAIGRTMFKKGHDSEDAITVEQMILLEVPEDRRQILLNLGESRVFVPSKDAYVSVFELTSQIAVEAAIYLRNHAQDCERKAQYLEQLAKLLSD